MPSHHYLLHSIVFLIECMLIYFIACITFYFHLLHCFTYVYYIAIVEDIEVKVRIVVQRVFTEQLKDKSSPEYIELKKNVTIEVSPL